MKHDTKITMSKTAKIKRRPLDGVLLLDKPKGISSNNILQKVKYLYRAVKAGHAGTLDPMATGLLPICFGEASKFNHQLLNNRKTYRFTCRLGEATNTGDAEGEVIATAAIPELSTALLETAMVNFTGDIQQIPPMVSALHHEGKRLYELAREGIEVARPARDITIDALTLIEFDDHSFTAEVTCSKGTYVRVLAEDIAKSMGTLGHLTMLRRTEVAPYFAPTLITVEDLEAALLENRADELLLPVDSAIADFPILIFNEEETARLKNGQKIAFPHTLDEQFYRLYAYDQTFLGLGERHLPHVIKPSRLIQIQ